MTNSLTTSSLRSRARQLRGRIAGRLGLDYSRSPEDLLPTEYGFTTLERTSFEITREWWRNRKNRSSSTVVSFRRWTLASGYYRSWIFWRHLSPEDKALEIGRGHYKGYYTPEELLSSKLLPDRWHSTSRLLLRWSFIHSRTDGNHTGETETVFSDPDNYDPFDIPT